MQKNARALSIIAILAVAIGIYMTFVSNGVLPATSSFVANTQSPAVAVPFTKVIRGTQSAITTRINYVIKSPTQLKELWKLVGATSTPPTVDFKTHTVIAVLAGKSSSSIAIAKIEDADARMVSVMLTRPSGSCASQQQTATPYEIIAVPTTSLPFTHTDIVTTASCPK